MTAAPARVGFSLDMPSPDTRWVAQPFRVSGWYLNAKGEPARQIAITWNGRPVASATRGYRADLASAFPSFPLAGDGSFYGDVVVVGADLEGTLGAIADGDQVEFGRFSLGPAPDASARRQRSYDLDSLLASPGDDVLGVRHFHNGDPPALRITESSETHGYPSLSLELIGELADGQVFLDFGAGIRPKELIFPNGVYLDAVHFPRVDVVSTCACLPFRDASFDLILSHAVFEHLPAPFEMANELHRVLKPGGRIYVETAFMQPFHGDPDHYFNMSLPGIERVFSNFTIERSFVALHQRPSDGLTMQLAAVRPYLASDHWRGIFEDLAEQLRQRGRELDDGLGELGRRKLAAGVAILARRI